MAKSYANLLKHLWSPSSHSAFPPRDVLFFFSLSLSFLVLLFILFFFSSSSFGLLSQNHFLNFKDTDSMMPKNFSLL